MERLREFVFLHSLHYNYNVFQQFLVLFHLLAAMLQFHKPHKNTAIVIFIHNLHQPTQRQGEGFSIFE